MNIYLRNHLLNDHNVDEIVEEVTLDEQHDHEHELDRGHSHYLGQWYMELIDQGPQGPKVLYGRSMFAAANIDDANDIWFDATDREIFGVMETKTYRMTIDGMIEFSLTDLPATWNFKTIELIDLDLAERI